jgi:hypothetical protein
MPIYAISQWCEAYFRYKSPRTGFQQEMGEISAMNVNGLPLSVLCGARPMDLNDPHIFLKPLKPFICYLKSKF